MTVLLLGASNLARAERAVAARLRRALAPGAVRILSAAGPGRAYRVAGGFLHVRYPPIAASGVLEAAEADAAAGHRTTALVTDIGNDIMFGVPAERLVETLAALLARLRALDARIVATAIPVDVRSDLGPVRFRILRGLVFPTSPVGYEEAARAVVAVNAFLEEQAGAGVQVLRGLRAYTGWDHVHYGVLRSPRAWTRITDAVLAGAGRDPGRIGIAEMAASLAAAAGRAGLDLAGRRPHGARGRY